MDLAFLGLAVAVARQGNACANGGRRLRDLAVSAAAAAAPGGGAGVRGARVGIGVGGVASHRSRFRAARKRRAGGRAPQVIQRRRRRELVGNAADTAALGHSAALDQDNVDRINLPSLC